MVCHKVSFSLPPTENTATSFAKYTQAKKYNIRPEESRGQGEIVWNETRRDLEQKTSNTRTGSLEDR
jgi:hypothetical protein